ncbi:MAG TPA: hypothetical protein VJH33_02215 [Candidatus Paceibacterota bacterium]
MNHGDTEEEDTEGGTPEVLPPTGLGLGDDEEGGFGMPEEKEWE